jgi:hypothetical protein
MAKPVASKKTRRAKTPAPAAPTLQELPGELRQLAEIRAKFPALSHDVSADLLAHHDDASCRERGGGTRAIEVFRGAMAWARTFGAHVGEPGVSAVRVRWFLDCLTSLGVQITGRSTAANPSDESGYDDAASRADKLLKRVSRRAYDAAGTVSAWRSAVDTALTPEEDRDARVSKLSRLAALLARWIKGPKAPPLSSYDLGAATVTALNAAATALDEAIANKPAPAQADRDSPAINTAEGRLLLVMRPLWDDLAEAREDGLTSLQLTVTPTLLRGLDLRARKRTKTTG